MEPFFPFLFRMSCWLISDNKISPEAFRHLIFDVLFIFISKHWTDFESKWHVSYCYDLVSIGRIMWYTKSVIKRFIQSSTESNVCNLEGNISHMDLLNSLYKFLYNVGFFAIFNLAKTMNRTFFTLLRFDFIIAHMNKIDQIV